MKRISMSVTRKRCRCRHLEIHASDLNSPIKFDIKNGQFYFKEATEGGGQRQHLIYHCPFCGGIAPSSIRKNKFISIPRAEHARLKKLTSKVLSIDDAYAQLGKPDEDRPDGITIKTIESELETPKIESFRTLVYRDLSEFASVEIADYRKNNVHISFHSKPIKSEGSA